VDSGAVELMGAGGGGGYVGCGFRLWGLGFFAKALNGGRR